ncbi:MAG: EamA family transporter [Ilumatobacteraceae bacterium]|mgnify:CR=1 FL=1|nr:EamA family transporter [Ilumatobacteraceae bacterium]MDP5068704.1 EamA family transporter [Ilumatobacteraceae bacterium]
MTSHEGLRADRIFNAAPPELFFILSAIAQYTGAIIAINLFDEVSPATVAWLRVLSASLILLAFSFRQSRQRWTRRELYWVAAFGASTALMNLFFYLAIDRLPLGKGVTIEFIGPITVAALRTRSVRNTVALLFAAVGVVVLGGVELGNEPLGLVFILLASVMWAGYIVMGSRVALADRGVSGLALGLLFGGIVITPFAAGDAGAAFSSGKILIGCILVGLLSNAIGYGIDQSTLRRIPIRRFSVMLALLPVCAAIFGFAFLDQSPSVLDLLGMALVLIGVAVQERDETDRHHEVVETT